MIVGPGKPPILPPIDGSDYMLSSNLASRAGKKVPSLSTWADRMRAIEDLTGWGRTRLVA